VGSVESRTDPPSHYYEHVLQESQQAND
jgi:hypothetical protein